MESRNKIGNHKIAIVGTGSLFPGAVNTREYWLNILAEKDFIKDVPESHWLKEDYYDPNNKTGDKIYCKKGAFLDDIPFDPVEFGIPPNMLFTTDTVQLLSIIVARDTLADTISYQAGKVDPKKTSVILGVAGGTELIGDMSARIHTPEWINSMRKQGLPESKINAIIKEFDTNYTKWNENTFPGLLGNVVSGRIANRFDLKGTNCVVDAACASSLAAVKMGIQELQLGTTDMVLTGGCDAINDIFMFMCFSKTTALSPTEDCKPFSDEGDGTILGEAIAMIALKRLEDAERDGDKIYAVINSIGSSSDGNSGSIYAPDSFGQSLAVKRAYEYAGYSPNEIGLVEAHGTGTMAGDYAEFNGLKAAYGETEKYQYCALGSVKSMIGHTKSAAGAASILKVAMSLNNAVLPPTIKIKNPNPKLNIKESPFYLNTHARPWIHAADSTRKAGVSSMGFGGTNFHVAIEEYDNYAVRPDKIYKQGNELFLFSGKSKEQIVSSLNQIQSSFAEMEFVEVAVKTQTSFNTDDNCSLAIIAKDEADLYKWINLVNADFAKGLNKISINNSVYYNEEKGNTEIAFLFSGQGSQYVNMGSDLLMQYKEAMTPWNELCAMNLEEDKRLTDIVYPIPVFNNEEREEQTNTLVDTRCAQPAIGVLAMSHLNILSKLEVKPKLVGGHSYGEIVALYAAGVIQNEADLVHISRKRGELMASASSEKGAMTAVFASEQIVAEKLKSVNSAACIANLNSPAQTVITGKTADVEAFEKELDKAGINYQKLNVSTAFHSPLVAGSTIEFKSYLQHIKFGKPQVPVYSNTTAKPYPQKVADYAGVISNQIAAPVLFEKQIKAMYEEGIRVFLEVGPGKVLSNFIKDILHDKPHTVISMDGGKKQNSKDAMWIALAQLSVAGVKVSYPKIWEKIDYTKRVIPKRKASIATVKLNGSNYGKPYPPKGGYNSLPKPNPEIPVNIQANSNGVNKVAEVQPKVQDNPVTVPSTQKSNTNNFSKPMNINNNQSPQRVNATGSNEQWIQAFQDIQHNMLSAQKSFQDSLSESHRLFLEASQTAFQVLGNVQSGNSNYNPVSYAPVQTPARVYQAPQAPAPVFEASAPQMQRLVPVETPLVHIPAPTPAPATVPVPVQIATTAPEATANAQVDFKAAMFQVVSEKTGYPAEILDLTTDLESGLGIDSIKRVEILSALQEVFPELKNADKAKLSAMNTLGEILDYANAAPASNAAPAPVQAPVSPSSNGHATVNKEDFKNQMFQIVSEKTGYPVEILDLTTDLESGLGIDSIKRVEILSALQEVFPELKNVDKAKLSAMNTLGEILDYSNASDSVSGGGTVAEQKKKPLASGNIFRYIVTRQLISEKQEAVSFNKNQVLYILPDDRGIAKLLEAHFKKAGMPTAIVNQLPDSAVNVLSLQGLNNFAEDNIQAILETNRIAFEAARICGKNIFAGAEGCLLLAFDNGLDQKESNNRAWLGGLSALAKTAKMEWPHAVVKSINMDCDYKPASKIADELFAAFTQNNSDTEVEIDAKGNAYRLVSEAVEMEGRTNGLKDGDTLVVSGGARGVAADCLIALTRRKKLKIGIIGRTTLKDEPALLKSLLTESELKQAIFNQAKTDGTKISPIEVNKIVSGIIGNREIRHTLDTIKANGSEVIYIASNINNEKEVEASVAAIRNQFGSIKGIIHAAGVLADKYIHEKTAQQFNDVFSTKIQGMINLLEACSNDVLTHICCFSSVSARMGNNGQADYAMANEVLNKVCQQQQLLRKNNCLVKSINWGPWDGGMVTPQLKRHFTSMGVTLIPIDEGAAIFCNEMEDASTNHVEIVVGGKLSEWGNTKDLGQPKVTVLN